MHTYPTATYPASRLNTARQEGREELSMINVFVFSSQCPTFLSLTLSVPLSPTSAMPFDQRNPRQLPWRPS
ncbi:hypothetical protein IF2G_03533 [Cordyceps javanica]|nr:hypothetical protein IF2G_03533 [Cordyceps javanica]